MDSVHIVYITYHLCHKKFFWKPEGKRTIGRPRLWWMDNIKIGLGEIGWGIMEWIGLA
jgi:hypothetical protein